MTDIKEKNLEEAAGGGRIFYRKDVRFGDAKCEHYESKDGSDGPLCGSCKYYSCGSYKLVGVCTYR